MFEIQMKQNLDGCEITLFFIFNIDEHLINSSTQLFYM